MLFWSVPARLEYSSSEISNFSTFETSSNSPAVICLSSTCKKSENNLNKKSANNLNKKSANKLSSLW